MQELESIISKIACIIIEQLDVNIKIEDVNADSKLIDLGVNSYNYIKVICVLEDEFDINFDDENLDVANYKTVRTLAEGVSSMLEG